MLRQRTRTHDSRAAYAARRRAQRMERAGPPPFGVLLRRYRQATELSQEALAERAGISLRTVNELERGGVRRGSAPAHAGACSCAARRWSFDTAAATDAAHRPRARRGDGDG